ncbi:receptor homology region, transmembrane domain- and RING domain-containing protein 1-like [Carex rostrata]
MTAIAPILSSSLLAALLLFLLRPSSALIHLYSKPFSYTFLDAPARFAVPISASGICGSLHIANPILACSPLHSTSNGTDGDLATGVRFVLISRGTCSFEEKVRNAQDAGFQAAIIYDDQDKGNLYSMVGSSSGINIHAVFVSKMSGHSLKKLARGVDGECCINSSYEETAGTVLVISFVSLVVIISVVATFLFARNCHLLRRGARSRPTSVKREAVELLPCFVYESSGSNGKHTGETCAICLEEYKDGEMLRVLPCKHEFHLECVDSWLTKWGTFCPVCKHEVGSP